MAKTVITAPPRPARPAPKHAPAPARQPQPPAPESSAAQPDQRAADLAALHAIEQRLSDGLAGVQAKQAEHTTALERIAEGLSALPGTIEAAEARLAALQQEQALLPRRLNSARAVLVGATGTPAESQAQAELAALQARQETLPPDLEQMQAAERETRAHAEQERARLEQERAEHEGALAQLRAFAEALQDEANKARRLMGEARLEQYQNARQQKEAALLAAEAQAAEARAALSAHDTDALAALQAWPDLRLQFSAALPVQDAITEQLEMVMAYRRALLDWQRQGRLWSGLVPFHWLLFHEAEMGYPNIQQNTIEEIERALRTHISDVQQRPR